jgi:hypothetical protein
VKHALGDAYAEPAGDVGGDIAFVKGQKERPAARKPPLDERAA